MKRWLLAAMLMLTLTACGREPQPDITDRWIVSIYEANSPPPIGVSSFVFDLISVDGEVRGLAYYIMDTAVVHGTVNGSHVIFEATSKVYHNNFFFLVLSDDGKTMEGRIYCGFNFGVVTAHRYDPTAPVRPDRISPGGDLSPNPFWPVFCNK